jgi:hypothetical protein
MFDCLLHSSTVCAISRLKPHGSFHVKVHTRNRKKWSRWPTVKITVKPRDWWSSGKACEVPFENASLLEAVTVFVDRNFSLSYLEQQALKLASDATLHFPFMRKSTFDQTCHAGPCIVPCTLRMYRHLDSNSMSHFDLFIDLQENYRKTGCDWTT